MRTPREVDGLWLEATCSGISLAQWERWMDGATRADHRLIDGGEAARFLQSVAARLGDPSSMLFE